MKRKRRGVRDIQSPSEEELLAGMQRMKPQYASYAAFCYLFGNRVSEGLGMRNTQHLSDYRYHKDTKKRDSEGKKYVERKTYFIPKTTTLEGYQVEPLAPWRIENPEPGILTVDIRVYKRSGRPTMTKIVNALGPGEEAFAALLVDYASTKANEYYLWSYSRQTAYRQFTRHLGVPPHKLREMRATKDAVVYNLDASDLKEKHGWVDPKMPLYYASKNPKDIKEKLQRKNQ